MGNFGGKVRAVTPSYLTVNPAATSTAGGYSGANRKPVKEVY